MGQSEMYIRSSCSSYKEYPIKQQKEILHKALHELCMLQLHLYPVSRIYIVTHKKHLCPMHTSTRQDIDLMI